MRERRRFLIQLGLAAATALLERARAADDARLETGYLEYGGTRCYVARSPQSAAKRPVVLILHGGRGPTPHIEEVARRTAREGFAAVAPDLRASGADRDQTMANLLAIVEDLAARAESGAIGVIGFRSGGTLANQLAVGSAKLAAASVFYGEVPAVLDVPRIKARLLLHYAGRDARINTAVPAYEAALNAAGVQNAIHVYPATEHGFFSDADSGRYNAEAAKLAWSRTISFLKDALR
jgi:carboxymethylenebutenolidase